MPRREPSVARSTPDALHEVSRPTAPSSWADAQRGRTARSEVRPALAILAVGIAVLALAAWWLFGLSPPAPIRTARAPADAATSAPPVPVRTPTASSPTPASGPPSPAPPVAPSGDATLPALALAPASSASASLATSTSALSPATAASGAAAAASDSATTAASDSAAADDYAAVARSLLRERMPRIAQRAERQLGRVLAVAAETRELSRRGAVRAAAQTARASMPLEPTGVRVNTRAARALNEKALAAYWRDNSVAEALALQTRAFGADPFDAEIVGNLAFLHLKERPPQAEAARQLALHALTVRDDRFPTGRIEDWTALAVADALTGHHAEAADAWFVSMALTDDLQRQCNAAIRAQAIYGERLRPSVQAMLQRARSSAAYGRCENANAPQVGRAPTRSSTPKRGRRAIP